MRYYFLLFFVAVITADVFAVIYASEQSQQISEKSVTFTREATSAPSYEYLVFTNHNKCDVVVTYIVDGCAPAKISITAGQSKRSTSAYKSSANVKTIVEPLYKKIELKNRHTKANKAKSMAL